MTKLVRRADGVRFRISCELYELRKRVEDFDAFLLRDGVDLCDPVDGESHIKDVCATWEPGGRLSLGRWMAEIGSVMLACPRASWVADFSATKLDAHASIGYAYGSAEAMIEIDTDRIAEQAGRKLERIQQILNEVPDDG